MPFKTSSARRTQAFSVVSSAVNVVNDPNGSGFTTKSSSQITFDGLSTRANGQLLYPTTSTISNVQITDSNFIPFDDTAVSNTGGYIIINGTGFLTSSIAYVNGVPANSTGYVTSTQLNVQVPPYPNGGNTLLYIINPDNTAAVTTLTYSAFPTWITGSTLTPVASNVAFTTSVTANSDSPIISYSLVSGNLPPNTTLAANGQISGNINTTISGSTTYNFTIAATDQENQNTSQAFSMTANPPGALSISPAVNGKNVWFINTDGPLSLTTYGTYKIKPLADCVANVSMWGGGGGSSATSFTQSGGGAGAATANVMLWANTTYDFIVGQGGFGTTTAKFGGGGGAGSGIQINTSNVAILVAGGGGGAGYTASATANTLSGGGGGGIYAQSGGVGGPGNAFGYGANTYIKSTSFVDKSGNNLTLTSVGNPYVDSYNPFTGNVVNIIGGSGYFDGASYLNVANGYPSLQMSSSDFTVETFINPFFNTGLVPHIISLDVNGSYTAALRLYYNGTTGAIGLLMSTDGSGWWINTSSGIGTLVANTWQHLALTKSGTNVKIYLNGVQQGATQTLNQAQLMNGAGLAYNLGYLAAGSGGFYMPGRLSNLRIVKDVVVYTGNFTPPTSVLTTTQNSSTNIAAISGSQTKLLAFQDIPTIGAAGGTATGGRFTGSSGSGSNGGNGFGRTSNTAVSPGIGFGIGGYGGNDSTDAGGGGGGAGYFGGGGGGDTSTGQGIGGGGGSGYANGYYVLTGTVYNGSANTPGNNSDANRGGAGLGGGLGGNGANGKIYITFIQ